MRDKARRIAANIAKLPELCGSLEREGSISVFREVDTPSTPATRNQSYHRRLPSLWQRLKAHTPYLFH